MSRNKNPGCPQLIAEIGLNHMGDSGKALRLLKAVIDSNVDAVTFQIRESGYYDETQPWKKPLNMDFYSYAVAVTHKEGKKIGFSVADLSVIFALNKIGVDFWKSLSWSINDAKLQKKFQGTGKKTYISTGMSSLGQVFSSVKKLKNIELIHTQLSHSVGDTNLLAITTLRQATKLPVCFGLHCENLEVLTVALGQNPSALFFYVKDIDKGPFPDDQHAVPIDKLPDVVNNLRVLALALGSGKKEQMDKKL